MKKKIFSKIYHPFLIKAICKLEIVGNLIKKNHKKSTAKIIRNGQRRNVPEGRNNGQGFLLLPLLSNIKTSIWERKNKTFFIHMQRKHLYGKCYSIYNKFNKN